MGWVEIGKQERWGAGRGGIQWECTQDSMGAHRRGLGEKLFYNNEKCSRPSLLTERKLIKSFPPFCPLREFHFCLLNFSSSAFLSSKERTAFFHPVPGPFVMQNGSKGKEIGLDKRHALGSPFGGDNLSDGRSTKNPRKKKPSKS